MAVVLKAGFQSNQTLLSYRSIRDGLNGCMISIIIYTYDCGSLERKGSRNGRPLGLRLTTSHPPPWAPMFPSTLLGYYHVRSSHLLGLRPKPEGNKKLRKVLFDGLAMGSRRQLTRIKGPKADSEQGITGQNGDVSSISNIWNRHGR